MSESILTTGGIGDVKRSTGGHFRRCFVPGTTILDEDTRVDHCGRYHQTMSLVTSFVRGFLLLFSLGLLTALLETTCPDQVAQLRAKKGGQELYRTTIQMNLFNSLVIGPLTYVYVVERLCPTQPLTLGQQLYGIVGVVITQNFLFYVVHRAYHEVKGLYWIHSFHHRFNEIILPSSAMAVSVTEFVTAYMAPIVIGCTLFSLDQTGVVIGAMVIGVSNVLIHTPFMVGVKTPWFLVTADDHFRHHRRLTTDYGAPLISFDRILGGVWNLINSPQATTKTS